MTENNSPERRCRYDSTETSEKEELNIEDLRGGAAKAAVADVTAKQRAARTHVEAPAPDNVLAVKAAEALRAVCGFQGDALPVAQERPVRLLPAPVIVASACLRLLARVCLWDVRAAAVLLAPLQPLSAATERCSVTRGDEHLTNSRIPGCRSRTQCARSSRTTRTLSCNHPPPCRRC